MKKLLKVIIFLIFSLHIFSCQSNKPMFSQGVSQGISGIVLWFEGDLMPGVGKKPVEGKPLQREIYIYQATNGEQAKVTETYFYSDIKTSLIKKVMSNEEGKFFVELEPGMYSVFVKEPKGLFASSFDRAGHINPIAIEPNQLSNMQIRVDYMAAY